MKIKDLEKAIYGEVGQYSTVLKDALSNSISDTYLDEIDDILLELCERDPDRVEQICYINLEHYHKYYRELLYGYTLNTLLKALIIKKETQKIMQYFVQSIKFSIDNDLYEVGKSITENVKNAFRPDIFKQDECLEILNYNVRFFKKFEKYSECITSMCDAAFYFSSLGASQSAYRILAHAQDIAINNNLLKDQAKILEAQSIVAYEEQDFQYAEKHFEKAINLLNHLKEPVPESLLTNLATAKMNLGKYKDAKLIFKNIVNANNFSDASVKCQVMMNLSVCQRETGEIENAINAIEEIISSFDKLSNLELQIEAHLIASKTYIKANNYQESLRHLTLSVKLIDDQLNGVNRLHYRRGIRERYISRIKSLLFELPHTGNIEEILSPLIFTKCNVFSDWLSVLDWCENIFQDKSIEDKIRVELREKLEKVINLGAPVLYGFREKYDDPFESLVEFADNKEMKKIFKAAAYHLPWQEFDLIMQDIQNNITCKSPFENSTITTIEETIRNKISTGAYLLFVFTDAKYCHLISIFKEQYRIISFPSRPFIVFYVMLLKYQKREVTIRQLISELSKSIQRLSDNFRDLFDDITKFKPTELIIFPDSKSNMLPMIPTIISNEKARVLLKESGFKIKYCPILYKQTNQYIQSQNFFGIWDSSNNLLLSKEELELASNILELKKHHILDLSESEINPNDPNLKHADIIHIAKHGYPISNFTDPVFATVAGPLSKNSVSLEEIQRVFWEYNYNTVVLNACDTSDITNRNYFKSFKTNEVISYSSIFLLNRKSEVISTSWPVSDIVAYIFSFIFYKNLSKGYSLASAYSLSIVNLFGITKDEILKILSHIKNNRVKEQEINQFINLKGKYPFRNLYCYGGYILNSLL